MAGLEVCTECATTFHPDADGVCLYRAWPLTCPDCLCPCADCIADRREEADLQAYRDEKHA